MRYTRQKGNIAMSILIHLSTNPEGSSTLEMAGVIGTQDRRRIQEVASDLHRARIIKRKLKKAYTERGRCFNVHAYYY